MSKKAIPYIPQLELSDCGAACLAMAMSYHGMTVSLRELRELAVRDRGGVDAGILIRAAQTYGFKGQGMRIDINDLDSLPKASILHWQFNHFVVYERSFAGGVVVIDPAHGRRRIRREELSRSYTGIALLIEPDTEIRRDAPQVAPRTLSRVVRQYWALGGQILSVSLVIQLFALIVPVFLAITIDRVIPTGDTVFLSRLVLWFLALGLLAFLGHFVRSHLLLRLRTLMTVDMVSGFGRHLAKLPYTFFLKRSRGDLLARFQSISILNELLATRTVASVIDGLLALIYFAILFWLNTMLAGVVAAIAFLQLSVLLGWRRVQQRLVSESLGAEAISQGWLTQVLSGIEVLKLSGRADIAMTQWETFFKGYSNMLVKRGSLVALTDSILVSLRSIATILVIWVAVDRTLSGVMTVGLMLGTVILVERVISPLANSVSSGLSLSAVPSYLTRIQDVLDHELEESGNLRPSTLLPLRVSDLTFRYGSQAEPVLRDISLALPEGSTLAIVGPSGSGKSTLLSLLLGIYRAKRGEIFFGDCELADLDLEYLRSRVGIVPQAPYLFARRVVDNVTLFDRSIPRGDVNLALEVACADSLVDRLPGGHEAILAEGGATLSGGERQRLTIARALVRKPTILLLDEATSALDLNTEAQLFRNLRSQGLTIVLASHKLSTIRHADLIAVLSEGRIVEMGSRQDLIEARGIFWELVHNQAVAED